MRNMKTRLLVMFMAFVLVLGLVACGGEETSGSTASGATSGSAKTEASKDAGKASGTTASTSATKAPAAEPTAEPTKAPVVDRTTYDMTDWKFYLGTIEQAGDFNGSTLVFARNKNLYHAGFIFVNADGSIGGYFFGITSVDERTGVYSITEEKTGEVAYFGMTGEVDSYTFDFGGLGTQTVIKQEEAVGQQYLDIAKKVSTNVTAEFLVELEKVKGEMEAFAEETYYCGMMNTGEFVYYSRTQNGTYNGLLILSADMLDVVVVQGYTVYDEATQTETIYDSTDYVVFYQVKQTETGYELSFANGVVGTATLVPCDYETYFSAMDYAYKEAQNNKLEEFVNKINQ